MIKKIFILLVLMASPVLTFAQFKVQSDGKIAIQTTSTAQSPIAINDAGDSSYYMYCNTGGISGMYLTVSGIGSGTTYGVRSNVLYNGATNVGLRGNTQYAGSNIGVMGSSGSGTKTIGLLGSIGNNSYGAGVYGTIYGDLGSALTSGNYAGFFDGNVKVVGNITATTTLQGTFLGESSSSSGFSATNLSHRSMSVAGSLSGLNVTTYQKERPERPKITETIFDDLDDEALPKDKESAQDIMDEQFYEKTHYALDADRLEETYPDLVYVNKDGSKVINYMEMIPLLVQSINELNEEIRVLKDQMPEGTARRARSMTGTQTSSASPNKLYQNTPNPFKEQTVIRFSLVDDVQDAAICIFDMTGKTVKKLPVLSGMESVSIGGYELGEGMFLYSLIVNGKEIDTKRMIISK